MSINLKGSVGSLPYESLLTDASLYGIGTFAIAGCAVAVYLGGGCSWYTGAGARMLYAAYSLFGLKMLNGELVAPQNLYEPRGPLTLKGIIFKPPLKFPGAQSY
jgi:hypothetical protein